MVNKNLILVKWDHVKKTWVRTDNQMAVVDTSSPCCAPYLDIDINLPEPLPSTKYGHKEFTVKVIEQNATNPKRPRCSLADVPAIDDLTISHLPWEDEDKVGGVSGGAINDGLWYIYAKVDFDFDTDVIKTVTYSKSFQNPLLNSEQKPKNNFQLFALLVRDGKIVKSYDEDDIISNLPSGGLITGTTTSDIVPKAFNTNNSTNDIDIILETTAGIMRMKNAGYDASDPTKVAKGSNSLNIPADDNPKIRVYIRSSKSANNYTYWTKVLKPVYDNTSFGDTQITKLPDGITNDPDNFGTTVTYRNGQRWVIHLLVREQSGHIGMVLGNKLYDDEIESMNVAYQNGANYKAGLLKLPIDTFIGNIIPKGWLVTSYTEVNVQSKIQTVNSLAWYPILDSYEPQI
ncbi:hypothetical protein AB832_07500 [Flavobacteriaceae bacterium (ex Bugula neritina AB1)]|nr:hypothetical protein AB832_07500 [Flavobacteriaceae bacterium (ex Bugula neritina AB1)]